VHWADPETLALFRIPERSWTYRAAADERFARASWATWQAGSGCEHEPAVSYRRL